MNIKGLDSNIENLVNTMNLLPGIETLGSCGGHDKPTSYQMPQGQFLITFNVKPNAAGSSNLYRLIQFALVKSFGTFRPFSAPPYLNTPGKTLYFSWDGVGDPEKAGSELEKLLPRYLKANVEFPPIDEMERSDDSLVKKCINGIKAFPGINIIGHRDIELYYVFIMSVDVSKTGWRSLEFLSYLANGGGMNGLELEILPTDDNLLFALFISKEDTLTIMREVSRAKKDYFIQA
jgi:hypothetical protein